MEQTVYNGNLSAITAITLSIWTFFTGSNVESLLRILMAVGSIVTAIMAITYYYLAIKEKRKSLKSIKDKEEASTK